MLCLLADENFNNDIVRGVRRKEPNLDVVRVQDLGLAGADDPTVLAWAADNGRILITHDVSTITRYAYDRVRNGMSMPGVFEITRNTPLSVAIKEVVLLAACSRSDEWEGQVLYLPLR